jgi:hypothetical protein
MGNYLSPAEFKSLTNKILSEFPEIFRKVHVGLTFNNIDMPGFVFAKGLNESSWGKDVIARPAVFLNGMHHARELSTLSMEVYLMLEIIFNYVHNDY